VEGFRSLENFYGDRSGPRVRRDIAPDPVNAATPEIHHAGSTASAFDRLGEPCSINRPKSNRMALERQTFVQQRFSAATKPM
jgi:hypothetical protein